MRIIKRATSSSHDRVLEARFNRYVRRAAQLLTAQPDLDEDALTRLLAAREHVDDFETCAAAQLAFFRREALSAYLMARDEFLPGARMTA
jgi:hypothetical protein